MAATLAMAILTLLAAFAPLPASDAGDCNCPRARMTNGWCRACGTGYLAGLPVKSHELYDILHTHGHQFNPQTSHCDSCREAVKSDGFCKRCNIGFVANEAYFSGIAYWLAKGKPTDEAAIACDVCRGHVGQCPHRPSTGEDGAPPGWCDVCKVGYFGNLAYTDKQDFQRALEELDLLVRALETTERCETCATAMLTDGRCLACGIEYRHGYRLATRLSAP